MKKQKSSLQAAFDEIYKAANLVNVWLILRNGKFAGRITSRTAKNDVLHVSFSLYPNDNKQHGIFGYRRMTGMGYPKVDEAVTDILRENSVQLSEDYHINLHSFSFPHAWWRAFENLGYSLLKAL